jgi:hypothetical protein
MNRRHGYNKKKRFINRLYVLLTEAREGQNIKEIIILHNRDTAKLNC